MSIKDIIQQIATYLGIVTAFLIGILTIFSNKQKLITEIRKLKAEALRIEKLTQVEHDKITAETNYIIEQTRKLRLENDKMEREQTNS